MHSQRLGSLGSVDADAAAAQQAIGLACHLDEGIIPVAPLLAVLPLALVDGTIVMADVEAGLQHQGDGELADGIAAVVGHVADGDAFLLGIGNIHHIVSGGQYSDQFQVGALIHGGLGDGGLVQDGHIGVANALGNEIRFLIGSAVIDHQLAQLLQSAPAQVARVFRIAVQHNDFHTISLHFFTGVLPADSGHAHRTSPAGKRSQSRWLWRCSGCRGCWG